MKVCRKCKIEYKDAYSFCPKCGTPYDENMKRAKVPGGINGGPVDIINKIWNIFLYGFGGLLILAYITTITKNPGESIFAILFGLSLFQVFYELIGDKFNTIDEKYLKTARVVLPILILIVWMTCFPGETSTTQSNQNNDNNKNNVVEKQDDKKTKEKQIVNLEGTNASEYYKNLCEVVGLQVNQSKIVSDDFIEYESFNDKYSIEVTANKNNNQISSITLMGPNPNESTNLFMALNRLDYNGKDSGKLTSFITENIGKKTEITIGDINFSMWDNGQGKPVIKAAAKDFDQYLNDMDN